MAVTLIGLHSATKTAGTAPSGTRVYLLSSDAEITTDIDTILDFTGIPAYNAAWDASDNTNLVARTKTATALQENEGYYWEVEVSYETPTGDSDQDPLDPRDRPWDWNKTTDKYQEAIPSSLYDTSGYVYPTIRDTTDSGNMINLAKGDIIKLSNGRLMDDKLERTISRNVFTMTKYVDRDGWTSIDSTATGWQDIDAYIDTVNDATVAMLDYTYQKYELLINDIVYEPYSENGFDVMRVTISVTADTYRRHIFSFLNQDYKQYSSALDKVITIVDDDNQETMTPQPLKKNGTAYTTGEVKKPIYTSVGVNELKSWSNLQLPSTIP